MSKTHAIVDSTKAIEINQGDAMSYGNRGLALLYQRRDKEAEQDFVECFRIDANLRSVFDQKAKIIRHARKPR